MITQLVAQLSKGGHQAHSVATDDQSDDDHHLEANMAALDLERDPDWYLNSAASPRLTEESSQLIDVTCSLVPSSLTTIGRGSSTPSGWERQGQAFRQ